MHHSASWSLGFHAKNIQPNRTILLPGGVGFSLSAGARMYAQTPYMHSSTPLNPRVLECMYAVCACIVVLSLSEKHTPPSSNIVWFGWMFFAWNPRLHDWVGLMPSFWWSPESWNLPIFYGIYVSEFLICLGTLPPHDIWQRVLWSGWPNKRMPR